MDLSNILQLLDQLIDEEKKRDMMYKAEMIRRHQAKKATGESFTLYHLKVLKDLIIEEDKKDKENFIKIPKAPYPVMTSIDCVMNDCVHTGSYTGGFPSSGGIGQNWQIITT